MQQIVSYHSHSTRRKRKSCTQNIVFVDMRTKSLLSDKNDKNGEPATHIRAKVRESDINDSLQFESFSARFCFYFLDASISTSNSKCGPGRRKHKRKYKYNVLASVPVHAYIFLRLCLCLPSYLKTFIIRRAAVDCFKRNLKGHCRFRH